MSDVQIFHRSQLTGEIKKYSPDFSEVIPTGASIPTGQASTTYVQIVNGSASGSAATVVDATGLVPTFTTPALSTTGAYAFTVAASTSDGQVLKALYVIKVPG